MKKNIMVANKSIAIYLHWPYCLSKCPYCDFNSYILPTVQYDNWLNAYLKEISYFKDSIFQKKISSIFFGGGTPSLMPVDLVEKIINHLGKIGIIDSSTEITLETNPTSFESIKFKSLKNIGVNRISIGVQSLRDDDLLALGRNHGAKEAIATIIKAKEIFDNVSFDLIYARNNQTLKDWQDEMTEALSLAQNHLSLYQLTIEKGTAFYQKFLRNELALPTEDLSYEMYEWTRNYLQEHNFHRYEISNYAKNNDTSKHNLAYWEYKSFIGIGPGAHSRLHKYDESSSVESIVMYKTPHEWMKSVNTLEHGISNKKTLSPQEIISEYLMMGLRLSKGINLNNFEQLTKTKIKNILNESTLESYCKNGFIDISDDHIKLTNKGLLLHNYIVNKLVSSSI